MSIHEFNLQKDRVIAGRYIVEEKLGSGWEGEVYKVTEIYTKSKRAIKLYYPRRDPRLKVSTRYAQKLYKLKDCPIVMNYHSYETLKIRGEKVGCLACEYIDGEILSRFVAKNKGNKLGIFPAIHLLYSITVGLEDIHLNGEYHGDLHVDNIMIQRFGLEFEIKIIDFHHWGDSKKDNREEDIIKLIRIFYDILGGKKSYSKLPPSIKFIICGLKRSLILQRFKTIGHLRFHLENMDWSDAV